jgi:hypothetical protein
MVPSPSFPRWPGFLALAILAAHPAAAAWVTIVNHSRRDWQLAADPNPAGRPRTGALALRKEMTIPPGNLGMFQANPSRGRLDQAFCLTDGGGRTLTFWVACDDLHPDPRITLAAPALAPKAAAEVVRVDGTDLEIRQDRLP